MMKPIIIFCFCVQFLSISVTSFAEEKYGRYINNNVHRELILNQDHRFYLINLPLEIFETIDTISFGTWREEKEFIVLNTPKNIAEPFLNIHHEEFSRNDPDSIRIEIFNPYEERVGKFSRQNYFTYEISIQCSSNMTFENTNENRLSIPKSSCRNLHNLFIFIIPDIFSYPANVAFNYLVTDNVILSNTQSDYIKITIPDFTFEYIGYIRFKDEYVKKMGRNLKLRGEIFKKVK